MALPSKNWKINGKTSYIFPKSKPLWRSRVSNEGKTMRNLNLLTFFSTYQSKLNDIFDVFLLLCRSFIKFFIHSLKEEQKSTNLYFLYSLISSRMVYFKIIVVEATVLEFWTFLVNLAPSIILFHCKFSSSPRKQQISSILALYEWFFY